MTILLKLFVVAVCLLHAVAAYAHSGTPAALPEPPSFEYKLTAVVSKIDNARNIIDGKFSDGDELVLLLAVGPPMADRVALPELGEYLQSPGLAAMRLELPGGTVFSSHASAPFPLIGVRMGVEGDSIRLLVDSIDSSDPMLLPYSITLAASSADKVLVDDTFDMRLFALDKWRSREITIVGFMWQVTATVTAIEKLNPPPAQP